MKATDVDLDVKNRDACLAALDYYVPASLLRDDELVRHPSGVYFQDVPVDLVSGLCSIPSKSGLDDEAGYWKFDLINNGTYSEVSSPEHLDEILAAAVDWDLLLDRKVVEQLHHVGDYFDLVEAYEPRSVEDLACILAMIRPAKKHLQGEPWPVVRERVWVRDEADDSYFFKKSHAISAALAITVELGTI